MRVLFIFIYKEKWELENHCTYNKREKKIKNWLMLSADMNQVVLSIEESPNWNGSISEGLEVPILSGG